MEGKGSASVGGYWARLNILDTAMIPAANFADIDLMAPVNLFTTLALLQK